MEILFSESGPWSWVLVPLSLISGPWSFVLGLWALVSGLQEDAKLSSEATRHKSADLSERRAGEIDELSLSTYLLTYSPTYYTILLYL